jgi:PhnB protein
MRLEAYLYFNGRTEEALAFYGRTINAQTLSMMRFKDSPEAATTTPEWQNKIMHATFWIGSSLNVVSDGVHAEPQVYAGFSLSISVEDAEEAEKIFARLSEGGTVRMPWQATFWTRGFGMVSDKFGIPWMVTVGEEEE